MRTTKEARVTDRRFGIELEVVAPINRYEVARRLYAAGVRCEAQSYGHATPTDWKIVNDGSLSMSRGCVDAFELGSPPLTVPDMGQIGTVLGMLSDGHVRSNHSCGFHVHHDAAGLTLEDLKSLYNLCFRFEHFINGMLPPRRVGNHFCAPLFVRDQVNRCETVAQLAQVDSRYHGVNLAALNRHGTVEFRYWPGTVSHVAVSRWILFTQRLVESAREHHRPPSEKRPVVNPRSCAPLLMSIGLMALAVSRLRGAGGPSS